MKKTRLLAVLTAFILFVAVGCRKMEQLPNSVVTPKIEKTQLTPYGCFMGNDENFSNRSLRQCDPNVQKTFFLKSTDQTVQNTPWNAYAGGASITFSGAGNLLSSSQYNLIVSLVTMMYSRWNVVVTRNQSQYNAAVPATRAMCLLSKNSMSSLGVQMVGGAYLNTFGTSTPSVVFCDAFNGNITSIAWDVAHEIGHMLGLNHQAIYDSFCNLVVEYRFAEGIGYFNAWATIMGNPTQGNIHTWFIGTPYPGGCNAEQNDLAIIDAVLGRLPDDYGNTLGSATLVTGSKAFNTEEYTDVDVFKTTGQKPWVKIKSDNLDYAVDIYNKNGVYIQTMDDPASLGLNMKINTSGSSSNTYYMKVRISSNQGYMPRADVATGTGTVSVSQTQQ